MKPHLKMAIHRFHLLNSKKTNHIKLQKKEIASLLAAGKEEKARIRVEHVIRMDFTIEAYEILELLCELIHERIRYLAQEQHCPNDMHEAICTLMWAANRTECPELMEVTNQFGLKFGQEFMDVALGNEGGCVNERVLHKLGMQPPSAYLVQKYLLAIAEEHDVVWTPQTPADELMSCGAMPPPTGFSVPVAPGSQLSEACYSDSAEFVPSAASAATSVAAADVTLLPATGTASFSAESGAPATVVGSGNVELAVGNVEALPSPSPPNNNDLLLDLHMFPPAAPVAPTEVLPSTCLQPELPPLVAASDDAAKVDQSVASSLSVSSVGHTYPGARLEPTMPPPVEVESNHSADEATDTDYNALAARFADLKR